MLMDTSANAIELKVREQSNGVAAERWHHEFRELTHQRILVRPIMRPTNKNEKLETDDFHCHFYSRKSHVICIHERLDHDQNYRFEEYRFTVIVFNSSPKYIYRVIF